jgi:uncharacterized lipoprotein YmbA
MTRRWPLQWWMPALASLLCACSATPSPRYYVLDGISRPGALAGGPTVVVDVVTVPAVVDRPQFVLSGEGSEVVIDDGHRWAAPLRSGVAEALARDLMADLDAASASSPHYRVEVEISAFESRLGDGVRLEAAWKVRRDDGASSSGRSRVREPAPGRDFSTLAAAHSRAIASLANEIALTLRELGKEHPDQHS